MFFFFFKQKTAYEMRISDWSSDVCSSDLLIAKFPDEMTIVLQNRFWDLTVEDDHFSVGLSFNQTPSMLTIPYAAITAFVDPSVDFGLQFQVSDDSEDPEPHDEADNDRPDVSAEDGSNVVTVDFGKRK